MKMFALLLIAIGIVFLVVGTVYPMVIINIGDSTPPIFVAVAPATGGSYQEVSLIAVSVTDPESAVKSVVAILDGTNYALVQSDLIPANWQKSITGLSQGIHTISYVATNNAELYTTYPQGTFTVSTALQGNWYVNDILITSPTQVVSSNVPTFTFKFVKTSATDDSKIACTCWEGGTKLFTLSRSSLGTWVYDYTFSYGKHTLDLQATDGTVTIHMDIFDFQVSGVSGGISMQMILWIVGAVFIVAGVGVEIVKPKGLPLEGKLKL